MTKQIVAFRNFAKAPKVNKSNSQKFHDVSNPAAADHSAVAGGLSSP
jgi:hypothetical protein